MRHSALTTSFALSLLLSAPAVAQQAGETPPDAPPGDPNVVAPAPAAAEPAPAPETSEPEPTQAEAQAEVAVPLTIAAPVEPAEAATPPTPMPEKDVAPPPASTWTPVFTGSYFTRHETRTGYHDLKIERPRFLEGDAIFYRARLGIGTGLIDTGSRLKVGLQATPQASGLFGTSPNTTTDAAFNLHEGYLRVQGQFVRADVGRFELNYGDALVIGNLDWNETGRSFDGARARFAQSPESLWVDLFVTLEREGRLPSTPQTDTHFADGDMYFMGVYAGLGPSIQKGLDLDAYALARVWPESTNVAVSTSTTGQTFDRKGAAEATFGARAKQKINIIDYRVEAGLQAGKRPDALPTSPPGAARLQQNLSEVLAYQADLEVGLHLVPNKLRVAGELTYASGDDGDTAKNEGWYELYPTGHKFLGLSDAFQLNGVKRTNVLSGVFRASTTPISGLLIYADGHLFTRPEPVNKQDGVAAVEFDVGANYVLTKGLVLRGMYALFLPNADMYEADPAVDTADAAQYTEIELRYDM